MSDHDLNYLTSLKSIKAQMNRQRGLLSHWHETTLMVWLSMYNFPPQIVPIFPLFYSCIVLDTNTGTTVGDWEQKVLRKVRNLSASQKIRIRNSDNLNFQVPCIRVSRFFVVLNKSSLVTWPDSSLPFFSICLSCIPSWLS